MRHHPPRSHDVSPRDYSRRPRLVLLACVVLLLAVVHDAAAFHPAMVFRAPSLRQVEMSPTGEWVAALLATQGREGIVVQRRGDARTHPVHVSRQPVLGISWVGRNTLLLTLGQGDRNLPRSATALRLRVEKGEITAESVPIVRRGGMIHPLPDLDEVVLWSMSEWEQSVVHRASIDALASPLPFEELHDRDPGSAKRVAAVDRFVSQWVADRHGIVRAYTSITLEIYGTVEDPPQVVVGYRGSATDGWRELWTGEYEHEDQILPVAVAEDNEHLVVLAWAGRDTRGLHLLDPESADLTDALFVRDNVDVVEVVTDPYRGAILAAVYMAGGRRRYAYFGTYAAEHLSGLPSGLPAEKLHVASASRDLQYLVLLEIGPANPGTYYYFAKPSGTLVRIGDRIEGTPVDRLVTSQLIDATSHDGTEVEGILYLPRSPLQEKPPMVVVPHGGPIGIADGYWFDPLAQYLAVSGIAVLQVNYRGSGGYGRRFEDAGMGEWGRGIEEDIDAVVQDVLDQDMVDPERMCIAGGSYGGYSALISAIQRPDRYVCVATLNGVTDIPLIFQGTEHWQREYHERITAEIVGGDPEEDYDELAALSPVYRVPELRVPVLVLQGLRDERVDPEHAYRLRAMLEVYDKPFEWLTIEEGRHAPTSTEWVRYASTLRRFLRKHLGKFHPHDPD